MVPERGAQAVGIIAAVGNEPLAARCVADELVGSLPIRGVPRRQDEAEGESITFWTLLSWVEGEMLKRLSSPEEATLVGEAVGRLHMAGSTFDPPTDIVHAHYHDTVLREAVAELLQRFGEERREPIGNRLDAACEVLQTLWARDGAVGLIHSDLHDGNLLWSTDRNLPAFIDFSRLGVSSFAPYLEMAGHYVPPGLSAKMLSGYFSVRPLSEPELAALPAFQLLAWTENLAILARHEHELEGVEADIRELASAARDFIAA